MTSSADLERRMRRLSHDDPTEEIRAIMARLATPRARLEWAVQFAQEDVSTLSRGRVGDLALEALVFGYLGGAELGGQGDTTHTPVPTTGELRELQQVFAGVLSALLEQGYVRLYSFLVGIDIGFHHGTPRRVSRVTWVSWERDPELSALECLPQRLGYYLAPLALFTLALLLGDYGHLVKACPAPKPRSRPREVCGRWFVGRPNQTYCSPLCQNRATTRASRQKKRTPARKRRSDRSG